MKKIISIVLVFVLCVSMSLCFISYAENTEDVPIKLVSDNKIIDGEKIIYKERTLIPVRKLLESVGALVEWDGAAERVDLTRNGKKISLYIGKNVLVTPSGNKMMDTEPILKNDTTFAPIRAIAEEFGLTVDWDGGTKTILISSPEGCPYVDFYDGMTVEQAISLLGITPEEFTSNMGLDYDAYKDKLYVQADNEVPLAKIAESNGMSFQQLKSFIAFDDSVTESTPWGKAIGNVSMRNYINAFLNPVQYGMSHEDVLEQVKRTYNLGDEYTLDTKFRYIRVFLDTIDYQKSKAEQGSENAMAEQIAKDLEALPALMENTIRFTITLEDGSVMKGVLYPDVAPKTVENFVNLVKNKFYDGLIFHRVIDGFMIQGGGYDREFNSKQASPIVGEFYGNGIVNALKHEKGVISMARTNDPNSASSEFFIMDEAAEHLDGNYAAFGRITEGIEVVEKISALETKTNAQGYENVPVIPVVIKSITIDSLQQ